MADTHKSKGLRRLLVALALVLAAVIAVPLLFRISIDLSGYKGMAEAAISRELGRQVNVDGDIRVTTSLWPYFEIQGLRISNPQGFQEGDLASMKWARVTVGLLPLLQNRIHIRKLLVDGLAVDLVRNDAGDVNWTFGGLVKTRDREPGQDPEVTSSALAVDKLEFGNISVRFRNLLDPVDSNFTMETASGSAAFGKPMFLAMKGTALEHPFTLSVEANSLGEFLAMTHSRLSFDFSIARTNFHFSGTSDALGSGQVTELQMTAEGDSLASLNGLLNVDLPPIGNYRLNAGLKALPGRLELNGLEARVKDSALTGSVVIDNDGARPMITMALSSEEIQLDDFDTGNWSPDHVAASDDQGPADPGSADEAAALDPETLQRVDVSLSVRISKVLSGEDRLGAGEMLAGLKDGRITIESLQLEGPKSRLSMQASMKPDSMPSPASLRLVIDDFDLGALMRLRYPESAVGGDINLDMEIKSNTSSLRQTLAGATGHFDISAHPENLASDTVDLWAVNLLSSVVENSLKGDVPQVNCFIGRWEVEGGVMTARNLAVDTSRIRICGTGDIDFNQGNFKLKASPKAKRPEFFSLATPLTVQGKFSDFNVGADLGLLSVGSTAVKFVVSPVTTPVARLIREDLPADGADICALPIGPHEGGLEKLAGC